jgi:hypothetical protein
MHPNQYREIMQSLCACLRVNCCIDIGHLGLWFTRSAFAFRHPDKKLTDFSLNHSLIREYIDDIQAAVESALPPVLETVDALAKIDKPAHFHLHDTHPLSPYSFVGVSDHLSFLDTIPLEFTFRGSSFLDPLFGPAGLAAIVRTALEAIEPGKLSFSLEIHPREGKAPLGKYASIFEHWADTANAERMNFWLSVLLENCVLVKEALRQTMAKPLEKKPQAFAGEQ